MDAPTTIPAETLLAVTLQAQQWNVIFAGLGELQHKVSAPIVSAMMEQIQAQTVALATKSNGVDKHPQELVPMPDVVRSQ